MVRDPVNRFTENVSYITFIKKTIVPAVSDGTNES